MVKKKKLYIYCIRHMFTDIDGRSNDFPKDTRVFCFVETK